MLPMRVDGVTGCRGSGVYAQRVRTDRADHLMRWCTKITNTAVIALVAEHYAPTVVIMVVGAKILWLSKPVVTLCAD